MPAATAFLDPLDRDHLARAATEIVEQISDPALIAQMKKAIPAHLDVPGMDALPNCVQVDFAVTRNAAGELEGKVVELQAFPSLYALMARSPGLRKAGDIPRGELLRCGQRLSGLAPVVWSKGQVHDYVNTGAGVATLFCCDQPRFIPSDEILCEPGEDVPEDRAQST